MGGVDYTFLVSPAITVLIAVVTAVFATKSRNDSQLAAIRERMAAQDVLLAELKSQSYTSREIIEAIARLEEQVCDLRRDVEKHNSVIERTYALEKGQSDLSDRVSKLEKKEV